MIQKSAILRCNKSCEATKRVRLTPSWIETRTDKNTQEWN